MQFFCYWKTRCKIKSYRECLIIEISVEEPVQKTRLEKSFNAPGRMEINEHFSKETDPWKYPEPPLNLRYH